MTVLQYCTLEPQQYMYREIRTQSLLRYDTSRAGPQLQLQVIPEFPQLPVCCILYVRRLSLLRRPFFLTLSCCAVSFGLRDVYQSNTREKNLSAAVHDSDHQLLPC